MMGIMAGSALLNREMSIVLRSMTVGTFRNGIAADRRMLFMAFHTGEFLMCLTMGINVHCNRIMTLDTVGIGERYELKGTGFRSRLGRFFSRFFTSGFRLDGSFGRRSLDGFTLYDRFGRRSLDGFSSSNDLDSSGINGVNDVACHEDKTSDTQ